MDCRNLIARARSLTDNLWAYGVAVPWTGKKLFIVRRDPYGQTPVFEECHPETLQMQISVDGQEFWEHDLLRVTEPDNGKKEVLAVIQMDRTSGGWKLHEVRPIFLEGTKISYLCLTGKTHPVKWLNGNNICHIKNLGNEELPTEKSILGKTMNSTLWKKLGQEGEYLDFADAAVSFEEKYGFDGEKHLYQIGYVSTLGSEIYALFIADSAESLLEEWKAFRKDNMVFPTTVRYISQADRDCRTFDEAAGEMGFPEGKHLYEIHFRSKKYGMETSAEADADSKEEMEKIWEKYRKEYGILPRSIIRIEMTE